MMTPARKLFAVRLDDDLLEGLDAVFKRDGAQPSEQVRRAVREWLEKKGVMKSARSARRKRADKG
jgi:metal-responsive CopG/Arc/MetJ family transcriptional regulator